MYNQPSLVLLGKAVLLVQHGPQGEKYTVPGDGCDVGMNCAAHELDD